MLSARHHGGEAMQRRFIIMGGVAAIMLAGCSPHSTQLSADTYLVKCEQMFGEMSDCVALARKQCPAGYDVLSAKDEMSSGTIVGEDQMIRYTGDVKRSMLIRCP